MGRRQCIRLVLACPAVHELMKERKADQLRRTMIELFDAVVWKAQAAGSLREDVGAGDVAVMFALLAQPMLIMRSDPSERCMALMLESLRRGRRPAARPARHLSISRLRPVHRRRSRFVAGPKPVLRQMTAP